MNSRSLMLLPRDISLKGTLSYSKLLHFIASIMSTVATPIPTSRGLDSNVMVFITIPKLGFLRNLRS